VAKRLLDILAAGTGLCLFLPVMVLLGLLVLVADGPPLFYTEQRVGRHGKLFTLYKLRTLRPGTSAERSVAPEDDPRISRVGLWLRRWRLDELPQLVNVLCGHMSLVGPRPMPPVHAALLPRDVLDILLSARPGMTDAAAIYFLAEDAVLAGRDDPEAVYLARFLPVKARMQVDSLAHRSFAGDLRILARTLALLWSPSARRASARAMRGLL
jgi:lipopolysaccharide/colanic/teichoic acid biosynthesis glycosyltransferase